MIALRSAFMVAVCAWAGLRPTPISASSPQVERAIRALREDGSVKVRAQAAFVLARGGAPEAAPALRRALAEDEAPVVRVAAAAALGRLGGTASAAALRDAGAHDPDPAVRRAAVRALEGIWHGTRTVSVEPVEGKKVDATVRGHLRDALIAQLKRHGFVVLESGLDAGYRLRPSVLLLDETLAGQALHVEVRASVVATDGQGRMAAMVEGGARAKAAAPDTPLAQLAGEAFDAAAVSISEDLARRLLEVPVVGKTP